jgi:hypothetical protein
MSSNGEYHLGWFPREFKRHVLEVEMLGTRVVLLIVMHASEL